MADWMSVKSISDKYGISESRVLGWIRECEITSSTVGSVVLIDDESVQRLIGNEKRLARLTTNYEQLCGKFERRIEAELEKDEDAALKMRLFDDFAPIVRRILSMVVGGLSTKEQNCLIVPLPPLLFQGGRQNGIRFCMRIHQGIQEDVE